MIWLILFPILYFCRYVRPFPRWSNIEGITDVLANIWDSYTSVKAISTWYLYIANINVANTETDMAATDMLIPILIPIRQDTDLD